MIWRPSHRFDPEALPLANRHYNRQSPDSPQFVPPGRCVVLLAGEPASALWVTSWPEFAQHRWVGAWINTLFRREGGELRASEMIRQAVAATRWKFGDPPAAGMVSFIDRREVRCVRRRRKALWGYSYLCAGFRAVGETAGGLLAFQLLPADMPPAEPPDHLCPLFSRGKGAA